MAFARSQPDERREHLVASDRQLPGALALAGEQQQVHRAREPLVGQAARLREPQRAQQQPVVKRRQRLLAVGPAPAAHVLERLLRAMAAERLACRPRQARRQRERHPEALLRLEPLPGTRLAARPWPLTHPPRRSRATGMAREASPVRQSALHARPSPRSNHSSSPASSTRREPNSCRQASASAGAAPAKRLARERRPDPQHDTVRRGLDDLQLGEVRVERVSAEPLADAFAKLDRVGLESHRQRRPGRRRSRRPSGRGKCAQTHGAGRASVRNSATLHAGFCAALEGAYVLEDRVAARSFSCRGGARLRRGRARTPTRAIGARPDASRVTRHTGERGFK